MGAALSVIGMSRSLSANQDETEAAQAEALANAEMADAAAADATMRGGQAAGRQRMEGSQLVEAQRVAYAASGVDTTVGTPANVMADTAAMSELDAKIIENNAAREAWGIKKHGLQYRQSAVNEGVRGKNRAAATMLNTASKLAASYKPDKDEG